MGIGRSSAQSAAMGKWLEKGGRVAPRRPARCAVIAGAGQQWRAARPAASGQCRCARILHSSAGGRRDWRARSSASCSVQRTEIQRGAGGGEACDASGELIAGREPGGLVVWRRLSMSARTAMRGSSPVTGEAEAKAGRATMSERTLAMATMTPQHKNICSSVALPLARLSSAYPMLHRNRRKVVSGYVRVCPEMSVDAESDRKNGAGQWSDKLDD